MAPPTHLSSHRVAVIGGGAAGLVAARELRREGHRVVVFERGAQPGGTWIYTPQTESDPIGLDPGRTRVHSSMYSSLRTNLSREVMGFRDFPFVHTGKANRDPRRFPSHQEVLRYLEDFAFEFRLNELVRYKTEVWHVGLDERGKWKVRSRTNGGDGKNDVDETYDSVVVCNGHYTEPRIAEIPGVERWPGKQIHSHNYRVPEPYLDQVVVLIGSSASAVDISRDIAGAAKEVHIPSRSDPSQSHEKLPCYDNIWLHPMVKPLAWGEKRVAVSFVIALFVADVWRELVKLGSLLERMQIESAHEDGRVAFRDGSVVVADVILHCTGYKYHFPFLETNGAVTVDDNRVGPLYKHVFPPALAPCLSFVGLPFKVVPFFLSECQSKWIAGVLSGRIALPSQEKMIEDVEAFYKEMEAAGIPKRFTHQIGESQFEYHDWLAAESGCLPSEEWRMLMYKATSSNNRDRPETYRDEWDDDHLVLQAHEDFKKYLTI